MVERRVTCAGCRPGILGEVPSPRRRKGEGQLDPFQLGGAPRRLEVGADLSLRPANSRIGTRTRMTAEGGGVNALFSHGSKPDSVGCN